MISEETFFFAIDRGGTFTDVYARAVSKSDASNQREFVHKLLSVDPENYPDAPREGIRRILEEATGRPHPKNEPLDTSRIAQIRMGTTVATNALLERKGEPFVLVTTRGFKDLLRIGNQSRPKIFDLAVEMPEVLFDSVIEIDERVTLIGYTTGKSGAENRSKNATVENDGVNIVKGVTGEYVKILKRPDLEKVRGDFQKILGRGIKSVAICLMHSFTFRDHEREIGKLARDMGFEQVTESSEIMPMIKVVARGMSACVDAYLTPCIKSYIQGFASGFDEHLHDRVAVEFMQSDGGLTSLTEFSGSKAILSGPAGGVVGYALTSYDQDTAVPVIGFDMGGTSTDVSRYHGRYEHVFETSTAGITIQAPQLDINTVAAGGGSRLFFRSGMFVVGPESAGAHPGPVCYRKGGPLAVTDANLLLGRIVPEHFPHIFGPTEDQPLDLEVTKSAFGKLANEINGYLSTSIPPKTMSTDEIAFGFIKVANESMCRAIRTLTEAKGHDTSKHILSSFGGAGGQHACAIAQTLGIRKIFIHRHSSILSAYGLSLADVVHEEQEPSAVVLGDKSLLLLKERIEVLLEKCAAQLETQGFKQNCITHEVYLNLRYHGTDCALMTLKPEIGGNYHEWDFAAAFSEHYRQEYGFHFPDRQIIVDDIRIRGIGRTFSLLGGENLQKHRPAFPSESDLKLSPDGTCASGSKCVGITSTYFEGGRRNTPVYLLKDLEANQKIMGPAMILDENTTVVVAPFCVALITDSKDIGILVGTGQRPKIDTALDPIQLAIFSHRFMSIAEQMGRVLERTAISTNIKERLDFSCALFGPDGGLVSNAPHIPIHLGSMQEAVKFQLKHREGDLRDGDVLLSNHPSAGGTHLPDITAITPVFKDGQVVFFVASRGHHADIGGISPGSMPPHSKELYQEGAAIKSFKLLDGGVFNEKGITEILMSPARHPGCSGTRNLSDNLSDLKAQVAANHKGINLVKSLMEEYGLEVVQAYMSHIRENAEVAVRELFMSLVRAKENTDRTLVLSATDSMDDGTPIQLRITIDGRDGSAVFDFEGTGHEVYGNTNAPPAVTYSAIIYCLRCLVGREIPLNQGCLKPVAVLIPSGSILSPSEGAAVVGGNVLTSQRLCDVVLKAFGACAASQGDMNNLTFGDEEFGYYETIGGGAGAGPTWHGRSGVHTHMTNTRITDPEVLERRYPILLHEFGLRPGSGGTGTYRGGDGVIREMEFTKRLRVSILSERRSFRPCGMKGGGEGKAGENLWKKRDGRIVNLLAKNSVDVEEGDRLRISTPGGGGYGKA